MRPLRPGSAAGASAAQSPRPQPSTGMPRRSRRVPRKRGRCSSSIHTWRVFLRSEPAHERGGRRNVETASAFRPGTVPRGDTLSTLGASDPGGPLYRPWPLRLSRSIPCDRRWPRAQARLTGSALTLARPCGSGINSPMTMGVRASQPRTGRTSPDLADRALAELGGPSLATSLPPT